MWMLPLYLHVNQKSDYDMIYMILTILYYIQIHVVGKKNNSKNKKRRTFNFFFCLFIFMVFPILLHCRPYAKAINLYETQV